MVAAASTVAVGVAVRFVPVPVGTPMAGFAGRGSSSTGVHDPMSVRALVIADAAFVAVDCGALHERTCEELRAEIPDLVLHATHTHSGPCVSWERIGTDSPHVRHAVQDAIADAVRAAKAARTPCSVSYTEVQGVGVAKNRRHLDRVIDPPVQAVGFDHDGARIATLVTYPCHPVVLDGANTLISSDYISPLRTRIETAYPGSVCIFATGAAGDVNTGHSAEASYVPGGSTRTFEEAERVGTLLADAVIGSVTTEVPVSGAVLEAAEVELDLEPFSADAVGRHVAAWEREREEGTERELLLETWMQWAEALPAAPASTWRGRVSVLRCGDLRIAGLPGEPFLAAADELRSRHDGPMMVLGYCDGVPGYLPTAEEYVHGGYEVVDAHRYYAMPSPFARGSLERVVAAAAVLLDA
ncbi:neutral/alkaline non-lysosomal ceramidase N-terminal domain-containing protein [Microbacterium murale]|uniref:Neutral ceramidase n=1 Tax=Microbacterium murale TaxID=1081040 RepID=A0ABU0P8N8_9MICO|nr:neutral/alkaline non-lysosomal ceramidase N-terminal domain-containing protein [Microbacterium murale]MDQ0643716.1 neutral ceramidase [Microbacterium murale]